jgi:flagellar motor protein MotB
VVSGDDTCLRIQTTLPILFTSGSAKVANEYQPFLKRLASFLKPYDVKVLVNGYADTVPINSKQYPSNFELGAARAANIVHQLVNQGLKPSIFKIETTGEYRFAAKEPSQQKSFQRRAQVTVLFSG